MDAMVLSIIPSRCVDNWCNQAIQIPEISHNGIFTHRCDGCAWDYISWGR